MTWTAPSPHVRGLFLAGAIALTACNAAEELREALTSPAPSPHEAYADGLRDAGLVESALGNEWLATAERALSEPTAVSLPYREAVYVAAGEARAFGYQIALQQGQVLSVLVEPEAREPVRIFVDAFDPPRDSTEGPRLRESADGDALALTLEADEADTVLLRVQPELLRDVRLTITIEARGALAFPVSGRDTRAVQSFFGASRDAGARSHHGIDIFAPRGTPVIAAAAGRASVRENRLGGKVVFVRDPERGISLYYAHLDSQIVASGTQVRIGDTLGLVGNSGNARSTPPHLHFGIYRRGQGPRNPYPYVHQPRDAPPPVGLDSALLGQLARVRTATAVVRSMPDGDAPELGRLGRRQVVRVVGTGGGWARTEASDGSRGYVRVTQLVSAAGSLGSERLAAAASLRDAPEVTALVKASLPAGEHIEVLGSADGARLVRANSGVTGWLVEG
jgi:murein DD-endopeptidase MepM/ murein hydrolase activator NlpD